MITSSVMDITPEMAAEALANGKRPRHYRHRAIARYVQDMRNKKWLLNGEPVIFDLNDELVDGYHRMSAVVEAGITVQMLVVSGVEPDAMLTINTGAPRSFSDHLVIGRGMKNSTLTAAVAIRMYRWDVLGEHVAKHSGGLSFVDLEEYFNAHEEEIISGTRVSTSRLITPSVTATTSIILRRVDEKQATDFMHQLISGEIEDPSVIRTLRLRIEADKEGRSVRGKSVYNVKPSEIVRALCFHTWNFWRDGVQPGRLILPHDWQGGRYPLPR